MEKIVVSNIGETEKFARKFARTLQGGELILLRGDLGAGKTAFTQFVADELGVKDDVTSPTFTIMKEYEGKRLNIVHFDLYRINNALEVQEFGFDEYVFNTPSDTVVLVEWPDNVGEYYVGRKTINITIEKNEGDSRTIIMEK